MIAFTVEGDPVPKGRPRRGKNGAMYTPKRTRDAEEAFRKQALPYVPKAPVEGPLWVFLDFVLPVPKSYSAKRRKSCLEGETWPGKPDIDNLAKLAIDAMTGVGFWNDDKQIVEMRAAKRYGIEPRTEVRFMQL